MHARMHGSTHTYSRSACSVRPFYSDIDRTCPAVVQGITQSTSIEPTHNLKCKHICRVCLPATTAGPLAICQNSLCELEQHTVLLTVANYYSFMISVPVFGGRFKSVHLN